MKKLYSLYKKYVLDNIDKVYHFLVCFFLMTLFAKGLSVWIALATSIFVAFMIVALIGAWKEYFDKKHTGLFSIGDLIADGIGIAFATFLLLI